MTTHTPCTSLRQLQDLPENARVCLYGSGAYARRLLELLLLIRPDLHIPFLVDSFKNGRKYDLEVVHIETLPSRRNEFDSIVVASSFDKEIVEVLNRYDFHHVMVPDKDFFFLSVSHESCSSVPFARFDSVLIEPTTTCNMRCEFCDLSVTSRTPQHMNFNLFTDIIDQICRYNITTTVNLHGDGEPLLYPHILPAIQYCKDKGLRVHINTNAMLLTQEMMQRLISADLDYLCISLHNMSEDAFRHRHPQPAIAYNDFLGKILRAIEYHATKNSSMLLEFILMFSKSEWLTTRVWNLSGIEHDTRQSDRLFTGLQQALQSIAQKCGQPFSLTREQFSNALEQLSENEPLAPVINVMPGVNLRLVSLLPQVPETMRAIHGSYMDQFRFVRAERGWCDCIKTPGFLVTGEFIACGYRSPFPEGQFSQLNMGRISEQTSIAELLQNKKYQEFLSIFRDRKKLMPVCQECMGHYQPA